MSVFSYLDYRKYLQAIISQNNEKRGYQSRLSQAMGCSKSLLSQVLKGDLQLTPEHVCRLSHHLHLSDEERTYLLHLLAFDRAGTEELKNHYQQQLNEIREQQREISERLKRQSARLDDQHLLTYASHWLYPAIHVALNIKDLRHAESLAALFVQPLRKVNEVLSGLRQMGLILKIGDEWKTTDRDLHIPKSSPVAPLLHSRWRQRVINQIADDPLSGTHYSGVHSLDPKTYALLKDELVELLSRFRQNLENSRNRSLIYLGIDLFEF